MRITALDIRGHQFTKRLSGFDRSEVNSFMELVAEDYEALVRETHSLRDQVRSLEERVEEQSANERALRETLVTTQGLCEELKERAKKEAELTLGAAELRAETILETAQRRAAGLASEIREMRVMRTRLEGAIRGSCETHLQLLESLSEDGLDDRPVGAPVTYLPPQAEIERDPSEVETPGEDPGPETCTALLGEGNSAELTETQPDA